MLRRFSLCSAFCFVGTVFNRARLLRPFRGRNISFLFLFFIFLLFSLFLHFFLFLNLYLSLFLFYLDSLGHDCSRLVHLFSLVSLSFFAVLLRFFLFQIHRVPLSVNHTGTQRHSDEPFLNHILQWGFNGGKPYCRSRMATDFIVI